MKITALWLFLASLSCCFGQTETNFFATGEWSDVVTDQGIWKLRGRLVIDDSPGKDSSGNWMDARVYVDLQNVQTEIADPIVIHFDSDLPSPHLRIELCDASGVPLPQTMLAISRVIGPPFTAALPADSMVRLRADFGLRPAVKPDRIRITAPGGMWLIPPDATNTYFLSATFSPPTNSVASPGGHLWHGMLKLPKVEIPMKKPGLLDLGTIQPQLDKIQKDYGVFVEVHGHEIAVGTAGIVAADRMRQVDDALNDLLGKNATNYTIRHFRR